VKTRCKNCGKVLFRPPSLLKGKHNIFCSEKCHNIFQDKKILFLCKKCGKEVLRSPVYIKNSRNHFCSPECFSKYHFYESFVEKQFEILLNEYCKDLKYSRNIRSIIKPLELDFYFPDINFAVEINGSYHYLPIKGIKTLNNQKKRDSRKRKMCKKLGIILRVIKPGNCKYSTFMPRYKRVIWEIKQKNRQVI